ncbi:MAG: cadherin-like beta sandwich domain-containing protein, partial [Spirochaetaceae bacterium]|nr:cadherin-like beta sandwich domain-containing protein [Spirochaetaceae bacterium]
MAPGHAFAQAAQPGLNLKAVSSIADTDILELDGAWGIDTFRVGGRTYAVVAGHLDDGVQILDLTDPYNITATDRIEDDGSLALNHAYDVATFEIDGNHYAAVTSTRDDGVQILDLTDPYNVTATDKITDTSSRALDISRGIDTFEIGGSTYAAVAGQRDSGVQILDLTDPYNVTATDKITDNDARSLLGVRGIVTFQTGGGTYAAAASMLEDGVQTLDLTDPHDIEAADRINDTASLELNGAYEFATFQIGGSTYAAVGAIHDNGVQILNLTDPHDITAADSIGDTGQRRLRNIASIATFQIGGSTYAAAASMLDDGVQILDLTDPYDITAEDSIGDTADRELEDARGIATFQIGRVIYAAVTGYGDSGVQIIQLGESDSDPVVSEDATLRSLSLSDVDIGTFSAESANYAATVENAVTGTTVTAEPNHAGAGVVIADAAGSTAGTSRTVSLAEGDNEITVTVTAEDGITARTYTVEVEREKAPLTGSYENMPASHDGTATFEFQVRFSETLTNPYRTVRDRAFAVTGGSVVSATRVNGSGRLWNIKVTPSGTDAVTIVLEANRRCSQGVCGRGGKRLSARIEATVAGPGNPVAAIVAEASSVPEGSPAVFEVTLDKAPSEDVTVSLSVTESGSMLAGTAPTSVTVAAGDTGATLSIATEDDSVAEGDGAVTATLSAGTGYVLGSDVAAEVTVTDDDAAEFAVTVSPPEIAEGESSVVTVSIVNGVTFATDQEIALSVSGTATGADYVLSPTALTLSVGASSATATLRASEDAEVEDAETVTVAANHDGVEIGTATVTIAADEEPPLTAQFEDMPATHDGSTAFTFRVRFSASLRNSYTTIRNRAFTVTGGTVRDADRVEGSGRFWEIMVQPTGEGDVTVVLEPGRRCGSGPCASGGRRLSNRLEATVNGPGSPEATIAADIASVTEGTSASFTVTLSEASPEAVTVTLSVTQTGQVLSGDAPASVTIQADQTSATFSASTEDDTVVEPDGTVTATLVAVTGYALGTDASASVTVTDDDSATFGVTAVPAEIEEGASSAVTVSIANGVTFSLDQVIVLSTSGTASSSDFTLSPASLTLQAGATSVSATLAAVEDTTEDESSETVVVSARHAGSEVGTATVAIAADEAAPLTAQFVGMPLTHDGESQFDFELRFSAEPEVSFRTLRDSAFEVSGGSVLGAGRLDRPSNVRWRIRVQPASDADVVLVLPATGDCGAANAICTEDDRPLSNRLEATVNGPGTEQAGEGFPLARGNSLPSGIWSDGETAWVADLEDARLYAYRRDDGEREPERDI